MNLHDIPAEALPTRAQLNALEAQACRERQQDAWEKEQLDGLPRGIRKEVLRELRARQAEDMADGNRWLLGFLGRYRAHDIPFNASEDDIGAAAERKAKRCATLLAELSAIRAPELLTTAGREWCERNGLSPAELRQALAEGSQDAMRMQVEKVCRHLGAQPPKADHLAGLIARLTDHQWWIRQLRTTASRNLEELARELGLVSARRGLYVSDPGFERFTRRQRANAAFLAGFEAINDDGEVFTLEDLSALGVASPDKRRAELMTRVRGMEEQARKRCDVALFATLTCPSRMHAIHHASGNRNPAFDGTTPSEAQAYLCKIGARIRSKLDRDGIEYYGLRVAEPHHDGTPHWHLLAFCPESAAEKLQAVFTHYAMQDSPDERGARSARCKFERIDWERGTAVGYVAKYVAKNVDGFGLNDAEHGQDAPTAAKRVRAWAATHGIRQFQQWRAAPVGLWREARRVPPEALHEAPEAIREACKAVHRRTEAGDRADFGAFCEAIGGVTTPRKFHRIKLAKEDAGRLGRYMEPQPPKPCGLYLAADPRRLVRSLRREWEIKRRARTPWTRLNNCTQPPAPDGRREAPFPSNHGHHWPDLSGRSHSDWQLPSDLTARPPFTGPHFDETHV
ncbi:replication endonuclease [Azoarcus sp. DN11]|uniref:replication endonuclease n=1 Tax=Azoarcus sp. DN11 TaxID=356837 RepID=UPI000EB50FC6|nr:replication endonuclease [Azoarcus sp. DN11]AYH42717.1 hypothetical protein CDA09_04850 [Azoarcus sp. DN11]